MSGATVVTNAKLLLGPYDLGQDLKAITLNLSSAMLDNTTFPSVSGPATAAVARVAGLKDASLNANGYVDLQSSASDAVIFGYLGSTSPLCTLFPTGIIAGSTQLGSAYALQGGVSKYGPIGGNVGTLLPFTVDVQGATTVCKATALDDFTAAANALSTGTTNGTAYGPFTFTSTQALYAGLHVTALSTTLGTTLSALVQQASSSGFGSSATAVTFSAQSCKYGTWATPVTAASTSQTFWRVAFTLSTGTSTGGSATGLIWMAIQ